MRLLFSFFLLTLVLSASVSVAAPRVTHEIDPISGSPKDSSEPKGSDNEPAKSTLQWQPPAPLTPEEEAILVEERRKSASKVFDTSFRLGIYSGIFDESRTQQIRQFAALRYDFNKTSSDTWQIEGKIGSKNFVHMMVGKKFPYLLEEVTAPYYRFAFGNLLDSTNGLGSIFNFKKFQAIAAIGLDDTFLFDHRLQLEIAVSAAIVGPQLEGSIGYAF